MKTPYGRIETVLERLENDKLIDSNLMCLKVEHLFWLYQNWKISRLNSRGWMKLTKAICDRMCQLHDMTKSENP